VQNGIPRINSTASTGQARDRPSSRVGDAVPKRRLRRRIDFAAFQKTHVVLLARPSVPASGQQAEPKIKAIATTIIPAKPTSAARDREKELRARPKIT